MWHTKLRKMEDLRKANQSKWYEIVEKYQSSEMTKKAFCAQEQINPATFYYWFKKYREKDQPNEGFITLNSTVKGRSVFIRYRNGVELELPANVSTQQIIQLIRLT